MHVCAIPKMRGKHATKPMEEVLAEAAELAADGVRELVIVAQDTTYYGMDLYGQPRLTELLEQLEQVPGIEWIRLMYLYPMYFGDELIEHIARSRKIVPYVDLPLQHISDTICVACSAAWRGSPPRSYWPSCGRESRIS